MWTVDKRVEKFEGKNVYSIYPQNLKTRGAVQVDFIHGNS